MRRLKLKDLIEINDAGNELTFDVVAHNSIPSRVFVNGKLYANSSIRSISSFKALTKEKENTPKPLEETRP